MVDGEGMEAGGAAEGAAQSGMEGGAGGAWFTGLDSDTKGWLENKGWSGERALPEVIKAHRNLESLVGRDKLPLPKDEHDTEGWNRVYEKLGRPARWEDYGIEPGE